MSQQLSPLQKEIIAQLRSGPKDKVQLLEHTTAKTTKEVNQNLTALKNAGHVTMYHINTRPIWQLPLERTAVDDLQDIVVDLKKRQVISAYNNSGRYVGICTLLNEDDSNFAQCEGKPEIDYERARRRAAHTMLDILANMKGVPKEIKLRAKKHFFDALQRGIANFTKGTIHAEPESQIIEFKGATKEQSCLNKNSVKNHLRYVGAYISAFINTTILNEING